MTAGSKKMESASSVLRVAAPATTPRLATAALCTTLFGPISPLAESALVDATGAIVITDTALSVLMVGNPISGTAIAHSHE